MHAIDNPGAQGVPPRSDATNDVAELLAFGVQFVELVSDEDLSRCRACRSLVGRILPVMSIPILPIRGCAGQCRCRLAPVSLE